MTSLALLTPDTLANARAINAANMPFTCRIQEGTKATLNGRTTTTYADRETMPCRVSSLGAMEKERLMGGAVGAPSIVAVLFPAGTLLKLTDRLIIVGWTDTDLGQVAWVRTYDVHSIDPAGTNTEVQRKVYATELP